MPQLIEHLAELTGYRDRDQLDVSVVRAVQEALHPVAVGIYRSVGDAHDQRWLTRARFDSSGLAATADLHLVDLQDLPALDSVPARARCLRASEQITIGEHPQIVYFPIATEREVIGVLELETAGPLAPAESAMVSTVVRIYGNFHGLLDHSEHDPLTGLLNRQTFNSALMSRSSAPPVESDTPGRRRPAAATSLWLGVVDIDHFKRVNDNFGHPIGDEVLLLLSRLLRSTFRHFDRLYRFGGEEFVVVLDCGSMNEAALAFERLRTNVAKFDFPQVGNITVSIGFTGATPTETPAAAFARADKALYHVKENGRNQVAQFEHLVLNGQIANSEIVGDIELF